jgi:hypothetical protein
MKPFTENDRYNYRLTPQSWVMMIGGYTGRDSKILAEKYGCRIVVYEPVQRFFDQLVSYFLTTPWNPLIFPVHAGIGATKRFEQFHIKGDMSGAYCGEGPTEDVSILPIADELQKWTEVFGRTPDLLVLNAEGAEYEILPALLDRGMDGFFQYIQVQPHAVVSDCESRWAEIRNRLQINFRITSEDPNISNGWLLLERK